MLRFHRLALLLLAATGLHAAPAVGTIDWHGRFPKDPAILRSPEAIAYADNLLAYQYPDGGWPKNVDMTQPLTAGERAALASRDEHKGRSESSPTIDNGATTSQIHALAAIADATGESRYREAVLRGLDYLFAAQYDNGGWPQFFPLRKGYYSHITFNDNATLNVLQILRAVADQQSPYGFVDDARRIRAADALKRGVDCVLRCQIVVDGRPTVWCAQHDEVTFAPAPARKFEPVSFTAQESAGLVRYLMTIDHPSPQIIASVEGAVVWFQRTQLTGFRFERIKTPAGKDGVIIPDADAPPLWARFYELGTERPIFIGRDTVIHYSLSEIERERRGGYAWYDDRPAEVLKKYPAWSEKWTR
jgi:PelA/Pel-15E family pectate lyase